MLLEKILHLFRGPAVGWLKYMPHFERLVNSFVCRFAMGTSYPALVVVNLYILVKLKLLKTWFEAVSQDLIIALSHCLQLLAYLVILHWRNFIIVKLAEKVIAKWFRAIQWQSMWILVKPKSYVFPPVDSDHPCMIFFDRYVSLYNYSQM